MKLGERSSWRSKYDCNNNSIDCSSTSNRDSYSYKSESKNMEANYFNKETDINLTGIYVNSKNVTKNKNIELNGKAKSKISWQSSEETQAELDAKLLTNNLYDINGEQKQIVQEQYQQHVHNRKEEVNV